MIRFALLCLSLALLITACRDRDDRPAEYDFQDIRSQVGLLQKYFLVALQEATLVSPACRGIVELIESRNSGVAESLPDCETVATVDDLAPVYKLAVAADVASESEIAVAANQAMAVALGHSHTAFIPVKPKDVEGLALGAFFNIRDNELVVREVVAGSAADTAGLKVGDRVLAIDGHALADPSRPEANDLLGFKREFSLQVQRPGQGEITIQVELAKWESGFIETRMLDGDIGYVRIYAFPDPRAAFAPPSLTEALADLDRESPAGWILDLRGNTGGSLDMCGLVAGSFLGSGEPPFRIEGRTSFFPSPMMGTPMASQAPVVVLVDAFSLSASEVLAETLRQMRDAVIVGEPTPGAAEIARVMPVRDGILSVTIASIRIGPKNINLEGIGVSPDHLVHLDSDDLSRGHDAQLQFGIGLLLAGVP